MGVFNSNVHKQFYMEGVQAENRAALPMREVATIETDNAEFIYSRYGADIAAQNSTDSTYTNDDYTFTADSKLINREAISATRISEKEMSRQGFDIVADNTGRQAYALAQAIHRNAARETRLGSTQSLAELYVTGSGSSTGSFALTDALADNVAASVVQALQESNCYTEGNPYAMMAPAKARQFNLFSMGAGFGFADKALENSIFVGGGRYIKGAMAFGGLDLIITQEVPRYAVLTFAGQPTANDTVTINGVVFTFVSSIGSTAGNVLIGANAEATIDNLVSAINGTAGAGTTYVAVSAANRTLLSRTNYTTARKLSATTMEVEAFVALTLAEAGTNTSWGTVIEPILAGAVGSTTIALPSAGLTVKEKDVPLFNGIELVAAQQHDATVWTKDRAKIKVVLTNQ